VAEYRMPSQGRQKTAERRRLALAARLTWKDASGALRFMSVTTRDVSESGAFVEAEGTAAIPLFRLVHLQLERGAREVDGVPQPLREGRVRGAIWRLGPCRTTTGTPSGYALRFLEEPRDNACVSQSAVERMAVAS
jgi:hypothetical protein